MEISCSRLPSPRLLSSNIAPDVSSPSQLDTHNVMQWGQFVDHDVTFTPVTRLSIEEAPGILCCNPDGTKPASKEFLHPSCFPIEIPADDPFFRQFGQRCMNFVRSVPALQLGCSFGFGEQMNQITHFQVQSSPLSLVELLNCCALIGPELQSVEIFSCTETSYYRRP